MTLEKKQSLRRVEFVCTDGCVNPTTHLEYEVCVIEDGQTIATSTHRENTTCDEAMTMIQAMQKYKYPEV